MVLELRTRTAKSEGPRKSNGTGREVGTLVVELCPRVARAGEEKEPEVTAAGGGWPSLRWRRVRRWIPQAGLRASQKERACAPARRHCHSS